MARSPSSGGYTSVRDMFDGGGAGRPGDTFVGGALSGTANALGVTPLGSRQTAGLRTPTSSDRPKKRPDVVMTGDRENRQYLDTTTGQQFAEPDYSAFSIQGLTSSDPANVARNRYGAQQQYLPSVSTGSRREAPAAVEAPAAPLDSMDAGNLAGEEASRRNAERSQVPTYEAGGMVGPGGVPQRPSTTSLDLPPALARMLAMPVQSFAMGGMVGPGGMPRRPMQSYAEGGMVGPGGAPQRPMASSPMAMNVAQQGGAPVVGLAPQGGQGRPLNFAAIDQQAQQFMQQNPQQVEQIKAEVQQSMASGEVDAQSLNMFVQVATTALQNPEMWPQLRQVLIQQGMLDAEDVSEEYDQGFLIILYIIGKTMGGGQMTTPGPQQAMPMSAGQSPQMSMVKGGALPAKSGNPDGSIPINAHEGEYVIPADVTRRLGTDHFDKLIAKARGTNGKAASDNGDDDSYEGDM